MSERGGENAAAPGRPKQGAAPLGGRELHEVSARGGDESERYATLLDWGTRTGLVLLVLTFFAYVLGLVPPLVPLEELPRLWNLPVKTYMERSGMPTGWGWLALAGKGDLANLVGIGILAGCSVPPLLGLIPIYIRRRDFVYAGICALVVLVLVLAASGVLTGGH